MKTLDDLVQSRLRQSAEHIGFALKKVREGNPFAAETSAERRQRRLQTKIHLTRGQAEDANRQIVEQARRSQSAASVRRRRRRKIVDALPSPSAAPVPDGRERIWGDTIDFVNVAFLEKGALIARSVGRVARRNGRGEGSGVLIGEGLFLTNHHVIESVADTGRFVLEFDYERDLTGQPRIPTRYAIDASVFVTDPIDGLDFTVVAVGERISGEGALDDFGFSGLSDAGDKHMIGEFANIVQHPNGRFKEVVLRENRLINRFDDALHYVADTEPGSSGSAVYNSEWQMIALHHWGGPWIDGRIDDVNADIDFNEGIRISSIVRELRAKLDGMTSDARARVAAALDRGDDASRSEARSPRAGETPSPQRTPHARIGADGEVTWTLPIEISVRIPSLAEATLAVSKRVHADGTAHTTMSPTPPDDQADDLKRIKGIGAKLERMLNRQGILRFRQIAAWQEDDIAELDRTLKLSGRITRDDWVRQASDLIGQADRHVQTARTNTIAC